MAPRDPAGMKRQRADGSVWQKKPGDGQGWTQLLDGGGPGGAAPAAPEVPEGAAERGESQWATVMQRFSLDGHAPEPMVHPEHVDIDLEGDTDSKPVLAWTDSTGTPRHSYTKAFHHRRAAQTQLAVAHARPAILGAHAALKEELKGENAPTAALALAHLVTGHPLETLSKADVYHNRGGGEGGGANDLLVARSRRYRGELEDEFQLIERSNTADLIHPDKVHYAIRHGRGHVILAPLHDADMAAHYASGLKHGNSDGARAMLKEHGLGAEHHDVVRAHAMYHHAADHLSKMPMPDLATNFRAGMSQLAMNVQAVSDHIAEQYGHPPAPAGSSYVPPALIAAYVEDAGGARYWPAAFESMTFGKSLHVARSVDLEEIQGEAPMLPHVEGGPDLRVIDTSLGPPPSPNREEYPFIGTIDFQGIPVDVENAEGTYRGGEGWKVLMHAHYGEIRKTPETAGAVGVDKDRLDVYVGPDRLSDLVVVVRQTKPDTGEYDEDKVILGYSTEDAAVALYKKQYTIDGFYGGHTSMDVGAFKAKIATKSQAKKPIERSRMVVATNEAEAKMIAKYTDADEHGWALVKSQFPGVAAGLNTEWGSVIKVFRSMKYGRKLKEKAWTSTSREDASSIAPSDTTSTSPPGESLSTTPIDTPSSTTPGPSPLPSSPLPLEQRPVAELRHPVDGRLVAVARSDAARVLGDPETFAATLAGARWRLTPDTGVILEVASVDGDAVTFTTGGATSPEDFRLRLCRSWGIAQGNIDHTISDISPKPAPASGLMERARNAYIKFMGIARKGGVSDYAMAAVTDHLVKGNYGKVLDTIGSVISVKRSAGEPPGAPDTSGKGGGDRRAMSAGAESTWKDGSHHVKVGPGKWRKDNARHKPEKGDQGKHGSVSLDGAEARLKKLREQRSHTASEKVKHEIDLQIAEVKERIKHLTEKSKPVARSASYALDRELHALALRTQDQDIPLGETYQQLEGLMVKIMRSATESFEQYALTRPGYVSGVTYLASASCPLSLHQAAAIYVERNGQSAFVRALTEGVV